MPTAVLHLDFTNLPSKIDGLQAYTKAFILLSYKSKPLGKTIVPVSDGCLFIEDWYQHLLDAVETTLPVARLHNYLQWDERDTLNYIPPKATIAVCTRDRPDDLRRCLDALMHLPDDGQEILVIDNFPSTDAARKLVAHYSGVRYICEKKPGLDVARNRALREAQHEVVAFTDDDATPGTLWLRALLRNFSNPLVMCVTGMTMPLELETEAQEAFENFSPFGKGFKRKVHTHATGNPLSTGQVGAGANMALRKNVVHTIGYFDEALDAGTSTQSGGDHEFFSRILLAGYQIVYEPEALSWHRHRRTWPETKKAIKGYGIGVYAYWTGLLVTKHELGILKLPYGWFVYTQLPGLIKSVVGRRNRQPLSLLLAELQGCFLGPWKYFASRKKLKTKKAAA